VALVIVAFVDVRFVKAAVKAESKFEIDQLVEVPLVIVELEELMFVRFPVVPVI
jgi:hypothetical protein